MASLNVLILDDESRICEELSEFLIRRKYLVSSAHKPSEAFQMIKNNPVDILFLDYTLPEMNGILVLKKIKAMYPELKVIMISGNGNRTVVNEAKRIGASDFLTKPFLHKDVMKALEH